MPPKIYLSTGGEGGIRTHQNGSVLHTFQACAFDRSATSPRGRKGTGGDPRDQIYGGAGLEGSGTECSGTGGSEAGGTEAGGSGTVCISLDALLGRAGL